MIVIGILFAIATLLLIVTSVKLSDMRLELTMLKAQPKEHESDGVTHDRLTDMESTMAGLPGKVLESINGSISNQKGKLAELIAYVNLKASYDKVIPLGNIVDFIGIRFPTDKDPGTFDFIDVKNGRSARLSEDQKQLQRLIQAGSIQFLKVKITTDNVADLPKDTNPGSDPAVQ